MPTSSAAAHVDPSARVLTASSAVLRAQLGALVMFVVVGMCVVSSLVRHVSVMTSEALVRVGALGRLVVLKARVASRGGMTGCGVHGADITGAPVLHAEEEPQDSNDLRWEH